MKTKMLCVGLAAALMFVGCSRDAQVASKNLSYAADNFQLDRRIVFYNGITGDYILTIEGKCSFDAVSEKKVDVTCKTGDSEFKKHSLGISDNVTYFSEQLTSKGVSTYHYKVAFKPQSIIPDIDLKVN
ncbi:beta-sandwich lipoprotein [Acinetobacter baumannii]|uniref:beta-sandwich lipoprotein n=1 Tax=Acinetobacter TaxID=469 RepID=UPI00026E1B8D|nr:hypothetical protein [Acinetobacter baumannii]AYX95781.1 hypothetical protein EGY13_05165 [Acinetobacter sp. FDAARGOS_493]EJG10936.1 hypothetical protein ACIN3137_A1987 [Acinetobacter baumannii OIFC137]EJG27474.1 putative lipoprotein [Acinetobacter baumannii OIFC109]EJO42896.1 putative lipoprotein [Acinetobacter baumannii IS-123]EJP58403.1 putative lipoprotein [Acinetobacter baumannii Naval-81]EKL50032.1 hypothetical protein ACINNAV13_3242 [Acinetobacter baumannii Naval-13]EKP66262.1 hypo